MVNITVIYKTDSHQALFCDQLMHGGNWCDFLR